MANLADIRAQLTAQGDSLDRLRVEVQALKDAGVPDQTAIDAIAQQIADNQTKIDSIAAVAGS